MEYDAVDYQGNEDDYQNPVHSKQEEHEVEYEADDEKDPHEDFVPYWRFFFFVQIVVSELQKYHVHAHHHIQHQVSQRDHEA